VLFDPEEHILLGAVADCSDADYSVGLRRCWLQVGVDDCELSNVLAAKLEAADATDLLDRIELRRIQNQLSRLVQFSDPASRRTFALALQEKAASLDVEVRSTRER
jgi:hypothetical protein